MVDSRSVEVDGRVLLWRRRRRNVLKIKRAGSRETFFFFFSSPSELALTRRVFGFSLEQRGRGRCQEETKNAREEDARDKDYKNTGHLVAA